MDDKKRQPRATIQRSPSDILSRRTELLVDRALDEVLPSVEARAALVREGADIWTAAVLGDLQRLSEVITADPESVHHIDASDPLEYRPIHYAAIGLQPEAAFLLLRKGADANARDHRGSTPLHTLFLTHKNLPHLPIHGRASTSGVKRRKRSPKGGGRRGVYRFS